MDAYCEDCAINRCDCYPDECPVKYPQASSAIFTCPLCGFAAGRFRSWVHAYMEWAWWRPFDKRPYHIRNRCVRWLP